MRQGYSEPFPPTPQFPTCSPSSFYSQHWELEICETGSLSGTPRTQARTLRSQGLTVNRLRYPVKNSKHISSSCKLQRVCCEWAIAFPAAPAGETRTLCVANARLQLLHFLPGFIFYCWLAKQRGASRAVWSDICPNKTKSLLTASRSSKLTSNSQVQTLSARLFTWLRAVWFKRALLNRACANVSKSVFQQSGSGKLFFEWSYLGQGRKKKNQRCAESLPSLPCRLPKITLSLEFLTVLIKTRSSQHQMVLFSARRRVFTQNKNGQASSKWECTTWKCLCPVTILPRSNLFAWLRSQRKLLLAHIA